MGLKPIGMRLGVVRRERERSLLFVVGEIAAIEPLVSFIDDMTRRDSRMRIIVASTDVQVLAWTRTRLSSARTLVLPFSNPLSIGLFLRRLNVRTVVFAEAPVQVPNRALLAALRQRAIAVLVVSARGAAHLPGPGPLRSASEALVLLGGSQAGPSVAGQVPMTDARVADMLAATLARDLKALREDNVIMRVAGRVPLALAASSRFRGGIAWRIRHITKLAELKQRLAAPRTIMCLGNGPSCEDPRLDSMSYDALFRVNHSWLNRNVKASPDVVFTGGKPTMRAVSGPLFGLQTPDAESRLMLVRAYNPLLGRTEFFNVNDMAPSLAAFAWGHLRPTNGASMLATAVALNPERLIVAGIDLFQHPDGSYPGDPATPNAYSPGHSRQTELDYIIQLFASFRGEIIIVGDILEAAWGQHAQEN
jgi:hypothetical protein